MHDRRRLLARPPRREEDEEVVEAHVTAAVEILEAVDVALASGGEQEQQILEAAGTATTLPTRVVRNHTRTTSSCRPECGRMPKYLFRIVLEDSSSKPSGFPSVVD